MRTLALHLAVLLVACSGILASGQQIFLESLWQNQAGNTNNPNLSLAVWAAGNESASSNAPSSASGFLLMESAVGQLTPQTLGYPQAAVDLANLAGNARHAGNQYRYDQFGNSLTAVAAA